MASGRKNRSDEQGAKTGVRQEKVMEEKLLLRVEEVAEMLNIGKSAVYDLMRRRTLVSVKIGRTRRVPVSAVRAYVDRIAEEAESA